MRALPLAVAGCLLLPGCAGGDATTAPTQTGGQTSTASQTPTSTETAGVGTVHLLYISDSSGWKTGEAYAALAQEQLGVPVELVDWRRGGLPMVEVPKFIRRLPKVVADAEIVVLWANPLGSGVDEQGNAPCMDEANTSPTAYSESDWTPFADLTGEVLDAIWEARGGVPTVVRVTDLYSPVVGAWEANGIRQVCMTNLETMSAALRTAAEAHGATFVSSLDVYNGADHRQDPVAAGLVAADGIHPGDAGAQAMAEALAASGFDPAPAP